MVARRELNTRSWMSLMMSVVTQPTDQEIRSCHVMYRVFCSWGKLKIDIPI